MEEFPKQKRELGTEEVQDAQIGLLEWELEERNEQHGIDPLTGLRRREVLEHELDQSLKIIRGEIKEKRGESLKELSLIFIDLDHFKEVNDTLGHPAGDEVLRKVSALLTNSVREEDVVARVGGEELVVLMRNATVPVATRHAEEIRTKVGKLSFDAYPELKVTASFGVVSSKSSTDAKSLYAQADKALYAAKEKGRNRVEVYSGE